MRTKKGLPFAVYGLTKLILSSIMARVQRDDKITLSHHLWMANHCHKILTPDDPEKCVKYYAELQKQITESVKKLLGLTHLNLWEGEPMLAEIVDLEKAKERIAYLYLNPSNADISESIENFPGLSSWEDFISGKDKVSHLIPWVRLPSIPKLPSLTINDNLDEMLTCKLKASNKKSHKLNIYPNAWMASFGVTETVEITRINSEIIDRIRLGEAENRQRREIKKKKVMGCYRLKRQGIVLDYVPTKRQRRVFVLSSVKERRINYISMIKGLSFQCKELYRKLRMGFRDLEWPPGMFRPPLPPQSSYVDFFY